MGPLNCEFQTQLVQGVQPTSLWAGGTKRPCHDMLAALFPDCLALLPLLLQWLLPPGGLHEPGRVRQRGAQHAHDGEQHGGNCPQQLCMRVLLRLGGAV
jgi:hypothetical protein